MFTPSDRECAGTCPHRHSLLVRTVSQAVARVVVTAVVTCRIAAIVSLLVGPRHGVEAGFSVLKARAIPVAA
ncbi:hypothetical protein SAMN05444166_5008 [Singulisphaera sp. GP187]|uniref:hypothetical protein n=1 Tax=Singulisphaera sp. GP187 TaxID=1882752 RepID=UPI000928A628|nr:hypothetical protein [Singulisphaera sp. GP187]SIO47001.1 hypothetical protein SAMN05444166_5008 [Singulisphaera sp. GP187]